jgi:hypothetical protein
MTKTDRTRQGQALSPPILTACLVQQQALQVIQAPAQPAQLEVLALYDLYLPLQP